MKWACLALLALGIVGCAGGGASAVPPTGSNVISSGSPMPLATGAVTVLPVAPTNAPAPTPSPIATANVTVTIPGPCRTPFGFIQCGGD